MNEILGSNIMRLRKENDLTQEQLANGLGITGMSNGNSWGLYITCFNIILS